MTHRSRTPPGLRKARADARDDWKNRGKPLPSEEMKQEVETSFARHARNPNRQSSSQAGDRILVDAGSACAWCEGTEFRRTTPDENWPRGRRICGRCHPEK